MYINVVVTVNGASTIIPVQFNHETLGSGEKVYFSVDLKGGTDGLTVNAVSSGTTGFAVGSVTSIPASIGPGSTLILKLFFVTPNYDYAGDLTVNVSAS